MALTYQIRQQISLYCCRRVQQFTNFYENYVQGEVDQIEKGPSSFIEITPTELQLFMNHLDDQMMRPLVKKNSPVELPQFMREDYARMDSADEIETKKYLDEVLQLTPLLLQNKAFLPKTPPPEPEEEV